MPLPDLSGLPPWAIVILAVALAVIFAVVWFGKQQGGRSGNVTDGTQSVELAVATIDSTAVKQVAVAVEALSLTIKEQNQQDRVQNKEFDNQLKELIRVLDEIKDEIRHQGEAMRK